MKLLNDDVIERFSEIIADLKSIAEVRFPRKVSFNENVYVFSDASFVGYGYVIYVDSRI